MSFYLELWVSFKIKLFLIKIKIKTLQIVDSLMNIPKSQNSLNAGDFTPHIHHPHKNRTIKAVLDTRKFSSVETSADNFSTVVLFCLSNK